MFWYNLLVHNVITRDIHTEMGKEEGGVHIYLFIYFVFIYLSFHMQDLCS